MLWLKEILVSTLGQFDKSQKRKTGRNDMIKVLGHIEYSEGSSISNDNEENEELIFFVFSVFSLTVCFCK